MKRTISSILFLIPFVAYSQISIIDTDMAIIGETISRQQDTLPTINEGSSGANQTWMLNTAVVHVPLTTNILAPNSTPYAADFPGSNLAMTNDNVGFIYFSIDVNNLFIDGAAGDLLLTGEIIKAPFNPDLTLYEYAVDYGDNYVDTYGFDVKADGSSFNALIDSIRLKHFGTVYDTCDGWGTTKTLVGDYNSLRVKRVEHSLDSIWTKAIDLGFPFPPPTWDFLSATYDTSTTYTWLAKEGKLAIAELTFDSLNNPNVFTWTNVPAIPVADYSYTDNGLGQYTYTDLSTNTPTTWFWDFGDGNTDTTQNAVNQYTADGTYNVCLTITNASGSDTFCDSVVVTGATVVCTNTSSFTSNSTNVCVGDTIILTNTGTGGTSYDWLEDGVSFATSSNTTRSFSTAGSYNISLVTDSASCSDTADVVITVNALPAPTISAGGPTSFCQGGNVTLTSSNAVNYLWSTSATTQNIMVSTTDSVTVSVTDANGCIGTSSATLVTVNSLPTPTISAGGPTTLCQGESVTLTSSSASSYAWSTSATTQAITVNSNGSYTVTVTDVNGCTGTSSATSVTLNPSPSIASVTSVDASACGASDGSITISASGGTTPYQYSIDGGSTFVSSNVFSGLISGNYDIVVSDSIGCTVIGSTVAITAPGAATVSSGVDDTICDGSTYTLSGSMGGSASSVSWTTSGSGNFDNPSISSATYTPSAADISTGNVTLSIITDDPDGGGPCLPATDDMLLTINQKPTADAGTDATICEGDNLTLAGSVGGSASSLTWSTSGSGTFDNTSSLNAIYTPSAADIIAGSVLLLINTNDPAGPCTLATDTVILTINAIPTVDAGTDATICAGSTVNLLASIGGGASTISWTSAGSGTFDDDTLLNAVYTPSSADITAGSVTLTILTDDPAGSCVAATDDMTITFDPNVTTNAGADDNICQGDAYTLAGTMGGGASSITWTSSGSGTYDDASLPAATYTPSSADIAAGTITLTITTNDPVGTCNAATDDMQLTINPNPALPTITQAGSSLSCDIIASIYQWYLDGNVISGAIGQFFVATQNGFYTVTATDANGCSTTSAPFGFTGINEFKLVTQLSIYPNPADQYITISVDGLEGNYTVVIRNIIGQQVIASSVTGQNLHSHRIDFPSLQKGLYLLELRNDAGDLLGRQKLVIER